MNDGLPPLRDVIAAHDLGAIKALGQHFLLDLNVTRKIARAAAIKIGDAVLEVGPGPGGLTRALLEAGAHVTAIERDARCISALNDIADAYPKKLEIIEADALIISEPEHLAAGAKIVSNLPYNISTELLTKWLRLNHNGELFWRGMALMFQKEVADRILAPPGSKVYGRLSVIAQAAARPARAFDLPARAFTPPPKVDSTVVAFEPASEPLSAFATLERITQAAFSQRRKMLRASLKPVFGDSVENVLGEIGVAPTDRAENIPVPQYVRLSEIAAKRQG